MIDEISKKNYRVKGLIALQASQKENLRKLRK